MLAAPQAVPRAGPKKPPMREPADEDPLDPRLSDQKRHGGALYKGEKAGGRRPPWTKDAEVAGPMSGHPRFEKLRSTWRYDGGVGCLVTAEDGTFGFGVSRYDQPVIHLINDHFGPLLEGENCMATEKLWDFMMRMSTPYGTSGIPSYAISAVDLALWDLKGKLLTTPVFELAGGPVKDDLFVYATGNDTDWNMLQRHQACLSLRAERRAGGDFAQRRASCQNPRADRARYRTDERFLDGL